MNLSSLQ